MRFLDEGPALRQRFQSTQKTRSAKALPPNSIDERVLPSLVAKVMSGQQPVVFGSFVWSYFPRFFGLNRHRLKVTWASYISERLGQSPVFDTAVYCITCAFLGQYHEDQRLERYGREMYAKAMSSLRECFADEKARRSRDSVGTTVLLSLFEALAITSEDSWVHHASGTSSMMALRGASAHHSGFDRCLYMSFRSFIVAQALVQGKPCIFEHPEWQAFIDRVRREDVAELQHDEPISVFVDISDRMFMEVAKFPGVVSEARQILSSQSKPDPSQTELLAARIWSCRENIRSIADEMRIALSVHGYLSRIGDADFVGPISSSFPDSFATCILRGTDTTISILDMLLALVASTPASSPITETSPSSESSSNRNSSSRALTASPSSSSTYTALLPRVKSITAAPLPPITTPCSFKLVSGLASPDKEVSRVRQESQRPRLTEWLDLVASSMGMQGLKIVFGEQ